MVFKPGQSGNPAGRKPGTGYTKEDTGVVIDLKKLAREKTEEALKTLVDVMQDQKAPPAAKVAAASVLLDRGWGKATQIIEAKIGPLDNMSAEELQALVSTIDAISGNESGDPRGSDPTAH